MGIVFDINNELDILIKKYKLDYDENKYNNLVKTILADAIPKKSSIAFLGVGDHTSEIISLLNNEYKIVSIFDKHLFQLKLDGVDSSYYEQTEIPLLHSSEINNSKFDVLIISSFRYRQDMKNEIESKYPLHTYKVIDIYENLAERGYYFDHPFFLYKYSPYLQVIEARLNYESERDILKKSKFCIELIKLYLYIKDFASLKKLIESPQVSEFEIYSKLNKFMSEVDHLLQDIAERMKRRKHNDIIISWNDQIPYEELTNFSYLKTLAEENLSFINAFSVVPSTTSAFHTMFSKVYFLDNSIERDDTKKGCVISSLEDQGYHFKYIGIKKNITEDFKNRNYDFELSSLENASTTRYWNALQSILLLDKPVCIVIHAVVETHLPYLSPYLTKPIRDLRPFKDDFNTRELKQQKELSARYWSEQLAFYDSFFKVYDSTRIFMSDHGIWYKEEDRRYNDYANHIFFIIAGKNKKPQMCDGMFSLYNFDKVLQFIIRNTEENFSEIFSNEVLLQDVDIYAFSKLQYLNETNMDTAMSYRCARGKKDKYILLRNGKEIYYLLPNESNNRIGEAEFQDRISELKKMAGDRFVNLQSSNKYEYVRELYEKGKVEKH
ncbi:hypothetical protein HNQ56_002082 [Anaerotaenia torta]|uniref:hypothetical protein n=1 Tax=Anaerotaenia torta TaxID=433293 RepID=UPI003D254918